MIPLRDVIPSRTRPWVTVGLIAINVVVFIWELTMPEAALDAFVREYGLTAYAFSWTSVVTSMFIHSGVVHAAANLVCLWIFGDNVEDQMGHGRFLLFYLLAGAAAASAELMMGGGSVPMVGASGAIAGVMGAYLVMFPRSEIHVLIFLIFYINVVEIPAAVFLPLWFFIQLLGALDQASLTAAGGIAFWAHIGGFLAGVAGVFLFRRRERASVEWWDAAAR